MVRNHIKKWSGVSNSWSGTRFHWSGEKMSVFRKTEVGRLTCTAQTFACVDKISPWRAKCLLSSWVWRSRGIVSLQIPTCRWPPCRKCWDRASSHLRRSPGRTLPPWIDSKTLWSEKGKNGWSWISKISNSGFGIQALKSSNWWKKNGKKRKLFFNDNSMNDLI